MKAKVMMDIVENLSDEQLLQLKSLVGINISVRIMERRKKGLILSLNEAKKILKGVDWIQLGATNEKNSKEVYEKWWDANRQENELHGLPRNPDEVYETKIL